MLRPKAGPDAAASRSYYCSTYVAGKSEAEQDGWFTRMAVAWNDLIHVPVVEDLCWYTYWVIQLLLGPLYAIALLSLLLLDVLRGVMVPHIEEPRGRAVMVTGCDSGFGRDLALALYERGWRVYAGCLTDAGVKDLAERCSGPNMVAVQMDVTKQADVDRVVARIGEEATQGLYALVNNAGIGKGAVVDWMPMSGAWLPGRVCDFIGPSRHLTHPSCFDLHRTDFRATFEVRNGRDRASENRITDATRSSQNSPSLVMND